MLGELFDPTGEILIHEHCRPHWSQAGAVVFVTFRTADSIPRTVVDSWNKEKQEWLRLRGIVANSNWQEIIPTLPDEIQSEFRRTFSRTREAYLDSCHGGCLLKRPVLAKIVADSLLFFDGQRYRMGDFVVMPNHVHLLAAFPTKEAMLTQCDSWMHYTARRINQLIGQRGKFWQQECFDHLVRSIEQYEHLRRYVAENPRKAGLAPGEYLYRRYDG